MYYITLAGVDLSWVRLSFEKRTYYGLRSRPALGQERYLCRGGQLLASQLQRTVLAKLTADDVPQAVLDELNDLQLWRQTLEMDDMEHYRLHMLLKPDHAQVMGSMDYRDRLDDCFEFMRLLAWQLQDAPTQAFLEHPRTLKVVEFFEDTLDFHNPPTQPPPEDYFTSSLYQEGVQRFCEVLIKRLD